MTMAGETRHTITPGLWAGLALAPLAWFVSQQVSYSLASFCIWGRSSVILAIHVAALVLACLGIAICWRGWHDTDTHGGRTERHFLCAAGALLGTIFLFAILAQGAAALFFPGCER
jgi:hypothetical protein